MGGAYQGHQGSCLAPVEGEVPVSTNTEQIIAFRRLKVTLFGGCLAGCGSASS